MSYQYRPPGRSNRSGRSQDNDVFEGLPVKQWGQSFSRISLAPPVSEAQKGDEGKWGEPPMPRDYQMLHPYTQHILRLARSGKVTSKRKSEADVDDDKPEDETAEEAKPSLDERGYVARKWKIVPEHLLEPEYKHFEFLAKRRKGMPNLYGPEQLSGAPVSLRKTKVAKADTNGEIAVYEVLVPEGQTIEGEVTEAAASDLAEIKPVVVAAPGTVIEGVGIANAEGVVVAEHLKPASASRRNRPPPKKKGGPGRGKKRVTFTNPDGSTYTTVVPNATKIVPQPGQTVKHVAKGEEATADVTAEEAAANATTHDDDDDDDDDEGSGSDEGEEGSDDDDREDGELSQDEDAATTTTPAPEPTSEAVSGEDVEMTDSTEPLPPGMVKMESDEASQPTAAVSTVTLAAEQVPSAEAPSLLESSLAKTSPTLAESLAGVVTADVEPAAEVVEAPHKTERPETIDLPTLPDRSESVEPAKAVEIPKAEEIVEPVGITEPPPTPALAEPAAEAVEEVVRPADKSETAEPTPLVSKTEEPTQTDGADDDLLGNLEKHIQGDS